MADKTQSLSLDETTATLKHLALVHATSYAVLNGTGPLREKLVDITNDPATLTCEHGIQKDVTIHACQEKLFNDTVARMVAIIGEMKPELSQNLERFTTDGFMKMISLWKWTTPLGKYFRVFTHGDFWTNNILFKYGPEGRVQDVQFIDYQYNHFGNIYEDLQYFI